MNLDLMCWIIRDGVDAVLSSGTGRPYISGRNEDGTSLHVHAHPDGYVVLSIDAGRLTVVTSLRPCEVDDAYGWLRVLSELDYAPLVPA